VPDQGWSLVIAPAIVVLSPSSPSVLSLPPGARRRRRRRRITEQTVPPSSPLAWFASHRPGRPTKNLRKRQVRAVQASSSWVAPTSWK